jgi:ferredoxin
MVADQEELLTVAVDRAECIGAGQCVVVAPRTFRLDAVMKAEVIDPQAEPLERLLEAAALCPTRAIYIARGRTSLFPPSDE